MSFRESWRKLSRKEKVIVSVVITLMLVFDTIGVVCSQIELANALERRGQKFPEVTHSTAQNSVSNNVVYEEREQSTYTYIKDVDGKIVSVMFFEGTEELAEDMEPLVTTHIIRNDQGDITDIQFVMVDVKNKTASSHIVPFTETE